MLNNQRLSVFCIVRLWLRLYSKCFLYIIDMYFKILYLLIVLLNPKSVYILITLMLTCVYKIPTYFIKNCT